MLAQIPIVFGAAMMGLLGTIHIVYTFFTNTREPRDAVTTAAMKETNPILTMRVNFCDECIGFNAIHGLGIVLFAGTYLLLVVGHMSWLRDSRALTWLPVAACAAYLSLSRYWFRTPLVGLSIATACFLAAAIALSLRGSVLPSLTWRVLKV